MEYNKYNLLRGFRNLIRIQKFNKESLLVSFLYNKGNIKTKMTKISERESCQNKNRWIISNNKKTIKKLLTMFEDFEVDIAEQVEEEYGLYCRNIFIIKEKMEEKIKLAGFSFLTFRSYLMHVEKFLKFYRQDPHLLGEKEIKKYILKLQEEDNSAAYVNQAISAIKFLYKKVLKEKSKTVNIPRPKSSKKLPDILNLKEVKMIINVLDNLKHKAILSITYSGGLRVSEVVRLESRDIDSERMLIHVRKGKGNKDRYTLLSDRCLQILRRYYRKYQPTYWLFPGRPRTNHLNKRSVQRIFKKACRKAKINKEVSIHSLRHSFATHLMDKGTDLKHIQKLMGHKSLKTTERYTHVTNRSIENITSPIDQLE